MIRKTILIVMTLMAAFAAAALRQLPTDPDVRTGKLDNGLTYYLRHNDRPRNRVDFYIAQKVGSVNEGESQRGLAHFLEHMCFNGTRHFPDNSLITYLESLGVKFGANLNAYTSTDETVYNICDVPSARVSAVDSCLLILRDWSHDLTLDGDAIDAERGVIKGEWRQRQGTAANRMLEKAAPEIYGNSIYGRRMPIGLMSVVENFDHNDLRDYYHKWYHPQNQCVVVVGDIDVDRIENKIRELWADVERPSHDATPPHYTVPENETVIVSVQSDPEQVTPNIQLYLKHTSIAADKENTIEELHRNLVADLVTRMLVERLDAVESASDAPFSNLGIGDRKFLLSNRQEALMFRASTFTGREAEAVAMFATELKRAGVHGFTPTEVARAKLAVKAELDNEFANRDRVTNTQYAHTYVRHYLDGGAMPSVEQRYKMMKGVLGKVDTAEVHEYISSVVSPDNRNVVIVAYLPQSNVETLAGDALSEAYTGVDASVLTAYVDPIDASDILESIPDAGSIVEERTVDAFGSKIWRLSNGVKVHLRHNSETPEQILIQGYSPGGVSQNYDPALASDYHLINDVLAVSGAGGMTSSGLRRRLVGHKANCVLSIDEMEEKIGVSTTPKDLETAMQVLYLKATDLRRDTTAYKSLIANKRSKLMSQTTNPTFAMGDSIHSYVHSKHPLGKKLGVSDLDAADYGRMMDLYADRFGDMSDFTFYITGDFNEDSLRNVVCVYLASLPGAGRIERQKDIGYRFTQESEGHRFTLPMATPQSIVYTFFHNECEYTLPNVVNAHVAGSIIQNRLREDLREKRGWTYGVKGHCGISASMNGDDPGRVIMPVYIRVAPEHARATFDAVAQTVNDVANRDRISVEEIRSITNYMLKQYEQNSDDNVYWLTVMHMYDKFGRDMHSDYKKILRSVTPESVAAFVGRYFGPTATRIQLEMGPQ